MTQNLSALSIRAASWLGAKCLREYCRTRNLEDMRFMKLSEYLEELATEINVPKWDERGNELEITGLDDPLPKEYQGNKELKEIISCVREISSSQIYGPWVPKYTANYLGKAMNLANISLSNNDYQLFASHDPLIHGWGDPVNKELLNQWQENA